MKKMVIFLFALVAGFASGAQSRQQIDNLSTLAQVWGLLKYYHPAASKGNPDWDEELKKMIPKVKAARSKKEMNELLENWYGQLPEAALASEIKQPVGDSIVRVFSDNEIQNLPVSRQLKESFLKLYYYHLPDSNIYVTDKYGGYQWEWAKITEAASPSPVYPAEDVRLLSLLRYWNIINYFYLHKRLLPGEWKAILPKYIPQFIGAKDSTAYRTAVLKLLTEIQDSHSFYINDTWNKEHQFVAPFNLFYLQGKYVIGESQYDSLMCANELKVGDEILTISNVAIDKKMKELREIFNGTNTLSTYRIIGTNLLSGPDSLVTIQLKRGKDIITKRIGLYTQSFLYQQRLAHPKTLWKQVAEGIWYVNFCAIGKPDTLQSLFKDIQQAKAVIWDMRSYPSFPVVQQLDKYIHAQEVKIADEYYSSVHFPGVFIKRASYFKPSVDMPSTAYRGKMIVLVGEYTQSLSESVAANLRLRPNTLVMGRQTAGTTGNIMFIDLPGDITVTYTALGIDGANSSFKQQKGVKIDKLVNITAERLRSSTDYVLEEAIKEAMK